MVMMEKRMWGEEKEEEVDNGDDDEFFEDNLICDQMCGKYSESESESKSPNFLHQIVSMTDQWGSIISSDKDDHLCVCVSGHPPEPNLATNPIALPRPRKMRFASPHFKRRFYRRLRF